MTPKLNHRRAAGYANIYTNNVQITYSNYDLAFLCSQNEGDADGALLVEDQAKINMSLEHAKVLSRLLADTLRQIEARFGTIPEFDAPVGSSRERGQ